MSEAENNGKRYDKLVQLIKIVWSFQLWAIDWPLVLSTGGWKLICNHFNSITLIRKRFNEFGVNLVVCSVILKCFP